MKIQLFTFVLMVVLVAHTQTAPQFISFTDGKLGVNFGGYHAAVGLGGLLGDGVKGGLFAEAGTPHGQSARAGLGGTVDGNGGTRGGLFAGATAGGDIQAAAGLGGSVTGQQTAGEGFASARAGSHLASSSLGGESSSSGSDIKISEVKSLSVSGEGASDINSETIINKQIESNVNTDINEIKPLSSSAEAQLELKSNAEVQVTNKEVEQPVVIEKEIIHTRTKPNHHHFHKTAYIGGYLDAASEGTQGSSQVIQKHVNVEHEQPGSETSAHSGLKGSSQVAYKKEVNIGGNSRFFDDIFNIPIATLSAVGKLLSNTAGHTNISIQKSGSVQAEEDSKSPKHSSISSVASSDAHISVQTPSVSQLFDDIFAIPINTLGAVNQFLNNNVLSRKKVQATQQASEEPGKLRVGPLARRRANKIAQIEEHRHITDSTTQAS